MAGYLPSSLAHPSGREPVDWSLGPNIGNSMPIPSLPPSSSSPEGSYMKPLDKEKASRNFKVMIKWFFSIDQNTTKDDIIRLLVGLDILRKEISYLPMTLVLHGTRTYDEPDDAYRKAKEATSRFTAAIHLLVGRLNILQPEKSTYPAELKPEEHTQLSQIPGCGEKDTLHRCLQALYSDFTDRLNHFSPSPNAGLPKSLSNALKGGWGLSLETCPAWLTSNSPWVLAPSALHVLYLSKKHLIPLPKGLVEWIMCILIGTSNMSRRNSISPVHRSIMRKAVYLLEDTIEDVMAKSTHNSYDSISPDLYKEFKKLLRKGKSIRSDHVNDTMNEELLPTIDIMAHSSNSYDTLQELRLSQSPSTSTRSPKLSKGKRAEAIRRKHESILSDLAWSKPKGQILKSTTITWIKKYIDKYTEKEKHSLFHTYYASCDVLLDDLILMAIQGIAGDQGIQKKMEEEVREFLTKRTLNTHPKSIRPLEEGKGPLSDASQWAYRSFTRTLRSHMGAMPTELSSCIRDFFYAIHKSYLSHRMSIDGIRTPPPFMRPLAPRPFPTSQA